MKAVTINHKTQMVFGKFKGALLGNVPGDYLIFLYNQGKSGRYTKYILDNMEQLKSDKKKRK